MNHVWIYVRVLAVMGACWSAGWLVWLCAVGFVLHTTHPALGWQEFPWLWIGAAQFAGLLAAQLNVVPEAPVTSWPVRDDLPRYRRILLVGPTALLWWPVLAWRARSSSATNAPELSEQLLALLTLPRAGAMRFLGWWSITQIGCATVIGLHYALPQTATASLALALASICGVFYAGLEAQLRSVLRPLVLSAPRHAPTQVPRVNDLRAQLIAQSVVVVIGALSSLFATLAAAKLGTADSSVPTTLIVIALLFFVFSECSAVALTLTVARDIRRARLKVNAAITDTPAPAEVSYGFMTRELQALGSSLEALLARASDANVSKYVAIERTREADRLKSQFLANMSHDLRAPLNAVIGFSELLLTGIEGELSTDARDMVQSILDSGRALLQQIDDILDTAKIQAGRMELSPEPCNVAAMTNRAIGNARRRVPPSVTFDLELSAGLSSAFVDPYRTVQALENLLVFASSRVESGTVKISGRPGRSDRGRTIALTVHAPIAPANLAQMHSGRDGFTRIPGHHGLGLTLPLTRSLLALQGGTIEASDEPPGMMFQVTLPAPRPRPVTLDGSMTR